MITAQPTALETQRRWLKPREWREMTGMPHGTMYTLIQRGEIKAVRIGDRLYIPITELDDFFERHGRPAA